MTVDFRCSWNWDGTSGIVPKLCDGRSSERVESRKVTNIFRRFYIIFTVQFLDYEPPEDGLVKAETYVGVKE